VTGYPRPGLATRLAAAFHGEVGAATVEAYRRAGAAAYSDQADAERVRSELVLSGRSIWTARPHQASQLLCAWNAFALQTLGDELVEADYRVDPRTVGYLPNVTAEQAAAFLGEVEHWAARARRAACDETYDITAEVTVPAPLPKWVEAEPCPRAHLDAMMAAGRALRGRVEAALDDLTKATPPDGRADAPDQLFGLAAEANTAIDFAESLWSPDAGPELHERVEESLQRAIAAYYRLGQLLAAPMLLDRVAIAPSQAPAGLVLAGTVLAGNGELALPGQPGFDPWCLTDPVNRSLWQEDQAARAAIDTLWRFDPNPAATLRIQAQLNAAVEARQLVVAGTIRHTANYFFRCPWSAIYFVYRPVVIAGQSLTPIQQFAFDVSVEPMLAEGGGEFARHLVFGPFHASSQVDYGDRGSGE
jgi:hypothetical protein